MGKNYWKMVNSQLDFFCLSLLVDYGKSKDKFQLCTLGVTQLWNRCFRFSLW